MCSRVDVSYNQLQVIITSVLELHLRSWPELAEGYGILLGLATSLAIEVELERMLR
jgi:hypothetical protein